MTEPAPEEEYDTEAMATRVVYELLGRRWVWPRLRVKDIYPLSRDLILTGRPVHEILGVTISDGTLIPAQEYQLAGGFRLHLDRKYGQRSEWPWCDYRSEREVEVDYVYGSPPPEQIRYIIEILKEEFDKGIAGDDECRLPKRVTSVSRQGLSMTVLDPQKFIDEGRTGIPEVDFGINVFNTARAKARARLFTSLNPPARRVLTEVYVEGP
jgi:hypothetical protein